MDQRGQSTAQALVAAVMLSVGIVIVGGVVHNANRDATRKPIDLSAHNAAVELEATMGYDPQERVTSSYKSARAVTYNGITIAPNNGSASVTTTRSVASVPLVAAH